MIWAKDSSPDSISYRLSRRDQGDGDAVGVEFDSYNDHRTSFSFWVNAAGTKVDYTVSNDGNEDETCIKGKAKQKEYNCFVRESRSRNSYVEVAIKEWGNLVLIHSIKRSNYRVVDVGHVINER